MITYTREICSSLARRFDRPSLRVPPFSVVLAFTVRGTQYPPALLSFFVHFRTCDVFPPCILAPRLLRCCRCCFLLAPSPACLFCPPSCLYFPPRCQRHCLSHDQGLLQTHPINAFRSCLHYEPVESNLLSTQLTREDDLRVRP